MPYGEDQLSDTEALAVLEGDTVDAKEESGRTVAYVDGSNESQSDDTIAGPSLSEAVGATTGGGTQHPATAEVALPRKDAEGEKPAPRNNGAKIAMLVAAGLAMFGGVGLLAMSGGDDGEAAANKATDAAAKPASIAKQPAKKPEDPVPAKVAAAKSPEKPDAGSAEVAKTGEVDAGSSAADAGPTAVAAPKQPEKPAAVVPTKTARKRRRPRRPRKPRIKRPSPPPPPPAPVRVVTPKPKPKPKPKPARPIALD